jgi:hypothetical protein
VRLAVLMVRSIEISLSRMTPCGLVNIYQLLEESYVLKMHSAVPPKYVYHLRNYNMQDPIRKCFTISRYNIVETCTVPNSFYSNSTLLTDANNLPNCGYKFNVVCSAVYSGTYMERL